MFNLVIVPVTTNYLFTPTLGKHLISFINLYRLIVDPSNLSGLLSWSFIWLTSSYCYWHFVEVLHLFWELQEEIGRKKNCYTKMSGIKCYYNTVLTSVCDFLWMIYFLSRSNTNITAMLQLFVYLSEFIES